MALLLTCLLFCSDGINVKTVLCLRSSLLCWQVLSPAIRLGCDDCWLTSTSPWPDLCFPNLDIFFCSMIKWYWAINSNSGFNTQFFSEELVNHFKNKINRSIIDHQIITYMDQICSSQSVYFYIMVLVSFVCPFCTLCLIVYILFLSNQQSKNQIYSLYNHIQ